MDTPAIWTMVIGMLIIWGGLAAAVAYAVRTHRASRQEGPTRPDL